MSSINLGIFGSGDLSAGFIGWSPVPLTVAGVSSSGTKSVTLKSRSLNGSISQVMFMAQAGDDPSDQITIDLGAANRAVILVAGKWQDGKRHYGASEDSKDVAVEAAWADQPAQVAGSLDLMIRVRKNANLLSDKARNDFLDALATLNGIQIGATPAEGAGKGIYVTDFVYSHVEGSYLNQHSDSMFLPWHRLYLLDLERLLQQVNPAVTLPYWKFDEKAPTLFTAAFMGETETLPPNTPFTPGTSTYYARFDAVNPLSQWKIGENNGIPRASFFDTKNEAAKGLPASPGTPAFRMIDQNATLKLGESGVFGAWVMNPAAGRLRPTEFARMEGAPHGAGHVSFNGPVNSPPVAPQDPIFFLLHCNVDRLWALWQLAHQRDVANEAVSYPYQTQSDTNDAWKVISSPQWPWDNSTSSPGQLWPPGTRRENFTPSPTAKQFDEGVPLLLDAIDPYAYHQADNYLGFAYDDVPFDYGRLATFPLT
jgi:tyrosinase